MNRIPGAAVLLSFSAVALLLLACGELPAVADEDPAPPVRALFVGNSYVAGVRPQLEARLAELDLPAEFVYIAPGGFTLTRHLESAVLHEKLSEERWDFVVLQDQSQTPALPGEHTGSFQTAVDELVALIRAGGAEPVLFETWGRRDGDKLNPELFPDYAAMQERLTAAYDLAAERHGLLVAPVGQVWFRVRDRNEALGRSLYARDGSHPGLPGAYLASCVIVTTLFDVDPAQFDGPSEMNPADARLIRETTAEVLLEASY